MKRMLIAMLCLSMFGAHAQAAGVKKVFKRTINEALLQGYAATPPAGWTRSFDYSLGSTAGEADQKIVVISVQTRTAPSATLPTPSGLTMISLTSGAILTKEDLPPDMQFTAAECTLPLMCQSVTPRAYMDNAVPGRLLVTTIKLSLNTSTLISTYKLSTYAFDPAVAVGGADRWTLIEKSTFEKSTFDSTGFTSYMGNLRGGSSPSHKLYLFTRIAPTRMQVYEILNK